MRGQNKFIVLFLLLFASDIFASDKYQDSISFYFNRTTNYSDVQIQNCNTGFAVIGDPATLSRFRALKPKIKILIYRDVRITRETEFAGGWVDYPVIRQYIVTDSAGNFIYDKSYPSQFLLDLTNKSCQNIIATEVSKLIISGLYDGVYFDECSSYHYMNRYSSPLPQYILDGWRAGLVDTLRKVRALLPKGKIVIGNTGSMIRTLPAMAYLDWAHDEAMMGCLYKCAAEE